MKATQAKHEEIAMKDDSMQKITATMENDANVSTRVAQVEVRIFYSKNKALIYIEEKFKIFPDPNFY